MTERSCAGFRGQTLAPARSAHGAGDDHIENLAYGSIRFDGGDGNETLVTGPTAGAHLLGGAGADLMVQRRLHAEHVVTDLDARAAFAGRGKSTADSTARRSAQRI